MAKINPASLQADPFWNKKMDKMTRAHDTKKNGVLERADFMMIVDNHKSLSTATPAYVDSLTKAMASTCNMLGLVDDSVQMTYEQFKEKWLCIMEKHVNEGTLEALMLSMFNNLDMNCDGKIDIDEWYVHCNNAGVSEEHARASFDAMDTNHDSLISKDEFYAYHLEFYCSTEDTLHSSILYGPLDEP